MKKSTYPKSIIKTMPLTAHEKKMRFLYRALGIRRDDTIENGFNIWIVADNLRKGAATNAVQFRYGWCWLGYNNIPFCWIYYLFLCKWKGELKVKPAN